MGNDLTTNTREFAIRPGMKPEDVAKSDKATPQQKKLACVFDADGTPGYSQREADVFNSTIITDKGKEGVSLWTAYADGSVKETKIKGDISSFKYAPKGDLKNTHVAKPNSIRAGMTLNEAYANNSDVKFKEIDLNKNGVIEDSELNIYTKPTIKITPSGLNGAIYPSYFYEGLRYDQIAEPKVALPAIKYLSASVETINKYELKDLRNYFTQIDTNHDGVLSSDEIKNCSLDIFPSNNLKDMPKANVDRYQQGVQGPLENPTLFERLFGQK